jgi:hypothetical protein
MADIQAVNRCRVAEAQKIDDGRMPLELVAKKFNRCANTNSMT